MAKKTQTITHNRQALTDESIDPGPGVFVRHPYQYGPRMPGISEWGTGKTQQSFKAETDINNILKKYQKTGAITHLNEHGENYGFATATDYHAALNLQISAQNMFNALPSSLRSKFEGDPAKFLAFVQDETNLPEMQTLGLLTPGATIPTPAEPAPEPVPEPSPDPTPT